MDQSGSSGADDSTARTAQHSTASWGSTETWAAKPFRLEQSAGPDEPVAEHESEPSPPTAQQATTEQPTTQWSRTQWVTEWPAGWPGDGVDGDPATGRLPIAHPLDGAYDSADASTGVVEAADTGVVEAADTGAVDLGGTTGAIEGLGLATASLDLGAPGTGVADGYPDAADATTTHFETPAVFGTPPGVDAPAESTTMFDVPVGRPFGGLPGYDDATAVHPVEATSVIAGAVGAPVDDDATAIHAVEEGPASAATSVYGSRPVVSPVAASVRSGSGAGSNAPMGVDDLRRRLRSRGGLALKVMLVLLLVAGAGGALVVTDRVVAASYGAHGDSANAPLSTRPSRPAEGSASPFGALPPGAMQPGMLPQMPIGPGLPVALGPNPQLGPGALPPGALPPGALPAGPIPPPVAPVPQGLGIGDVIGALFDSAHGAFASHFDNSGGPGLIEYGPAPSLIASPTTPGRQAYYFSLPPGGKRSEVLPVGPGTQPQDGETQFVRYSALLGRDFPTNVPEWQIILQWHQQQDTGSPPLALQVTQGGLFMVSGGMEARPLGPIAAGQPVNLTMQVRFSRFPALSSVTVFRDGRPTAVQDWHPAGGTMYSPFAYMKMGMYRSQSIPYGGSVAITDLKVGHTPDAIGGMGALAQR